MSSRASLLGSRQMTPSSGVKATRKSLPSWRSLSRGSGQPAASFTTSRTRSRMPAFRTGALPFDHQALRRQGAYGGARWSDDRRDEEEWRDCGEGGRLRGGRDRECGGEERRFDAEGGERGIAGGRKGRSGLKSWCVSLSCRSRVRLTPLPFVQRCRSLILRSPLALRYGNEFLPVPCRA